MILQADNVWADVIEWGPANGAAEERFLWDYLSIREKGAFFSEAYKSGRWDGRTRLYDRQRRRFPSGLVRMAVERAKFVGVAIHVRDARDVPSVSVTDPERFDWLRDYQLAAVRAVFKRTRGIVQAPPGAGKTQMFTALGLAAPTEWLVLVDTKDLMHQAAERFERYSGGEKAGRLGDGVQDIRRYTVATVQTIDARWQDDEVRGLVMGCRGVVFDEVQGAAGKRNYEILMAARRAYWRVGFSATPTERKDGTDVKAVAALGPVCHHVPEQKLVEAGAIADARVRFVRCEHPAYLDWPTAKQRGIVDCAARNDAVVEMAMRAERPTLVHARYKEHVLELERRLRERGLRVDHVWGETDSAARRTLVKRLEHRDLDVLVVSKVFDKGVDIPEARAVVNAAGGDSTADPVQLLGRAGRAIAGRKNTCEYWDVEDVGDKILAKHARHRMASLTSRGWRVEKLARPEDAGTAPDRG